MMSTLYPKIQTMFKRDPTTHRIIQGNWSTVELDYLQDSEWEFTEKVDGTNVRIGWDGKDVRIGGKTENASLHPTLQDALADLFLGYEDNLRDVFPDGEAILYGEGYGPKVQSGGKYRPDMGFVLFDVKVGPWWLNRDSIMDVASKLGLRVVPFVGRGTLWDAVAIVGDGLQSSWGNFPAEGIVAKPIVELHDRKGERIITKIKAVDFRE